MDAGELRYRITIQSRVDDVSPGGSVKSTYKPLCTVWASINHDSSKGDEKLIGNQIIPQSVWEFKVRYSSDTKQIRPKDRVIYGTGLDGETGPRYFDLFDVVPIGYREGFLLRGKLKDGNSY